MTQRQFARALNVSISTISGYEIGDTFPSIDSAIRISELGTVSLAWLLTGKQIEVYENPQVDLTPEEARLLIAYRNLTHMNQTAVLRITEGMQK